MILKAIRFYKYEPMFKHPIVTPKVELVSRQTLMIALVDENNRAWFGECNAFETDWYHFETIDSVYHTLKKWFEEVKDTEIVSFESAQNIATSLKDYPAARATVMMAFYQMFHQLTSFQVEMTATINGDLNQRIVHLNHPGRIKLKWNDDIMNQVKWISQLYPEIPLSIDANQSLNSEDYITLQTLKQYHMAFIEEPFLDYEGIQHQYEGPPIALDEKATDYDAIIDLIHRYPIEVVVIKPFRLGGIDIALKLIQELQRKQIKVVVGGMYELGLSRYFTAYLSQFGDFAGDITPMGYYYDEDIVQNSGILENGKLTFHQPIVNTTLLQQIKV
ncbi:o-succinylbenzoate synthase [Staphylococcus canis]|uniref:o-succinylbenzoate synthase n=1 Tax=Staphylococcus canis TaxID=2724942 RepID=A0ABS0TAC9_9STAP|nr:o-succinylbenzoate synthase [Staphylococcus canis]MBI5975705.1 o-succinylbenzoate synthase [Staphylococcus canis]